MTNTQEFRPDLGDTGQNKKGPIAGTPVFMVGSESLELPTSSVSRKNRANDTNGHDCNPLIPNGANWALAARIGRRRTTTFRTCQHCGTGFETEARYARRGGAKYCSIHCSATAQWRRNPGQSETATRRRARNMWIRRHGGQQPLCEICGAPADIHHEDANIRNNAPSNLRTLCRSHHISLENARRKRTGAAR